MYNGYGSTAVKWGKLVGSRDEEYYAFYLPHSCSEWVIGGVEEVDALIKDLEELKNEVETRRRQMCKEAPR